MLFTFTREVCHALCAHVSRLLAVVAARACHPRTLLHWPLDVVAARTTHPGLHHRERTNGLLAPPRHEPLAEQTGSDARKDGSRAQPHGHGRRRLVACCAIER